MTFLYRLNKLIQNNQRQEKDMKMVLKCTKKKQCKKFAKFSLELLTNKNVKKPKAMLHDYLNHIGVAFLTGNLISLPLQP